MELTRDWRVVRTGSANQKEVTKTKVKVGVVTKEREEELELLKLVFEAMSNPEKYPKVRVCHSDDDIGLRRHG